MMVKLMMYLEYLLSIGLMKLREALQIEKTVQPGRVLVHAFEMIEKSCK